MKRFLLLLLFIGGLQVNISAEEYPNVLVIKFKNTNKENIVIPIEGTRLSFHEYMDVNGRRHLEMIYSDGSHINLDSVQVMTYEYSEDVLLDIKKVNTSEGMFVSVYYIDGRCVLSNVSSVQQALALLPKGIYVVKENGRTYKIVK